MAAPLEKVNDNTSKLGKISDLYKTNQVRMKSAEVSFCTRGNANVFPKLSIFYFTVTLDTLAWSEVTGLAASYL